MAQTMTYSKEQNIKYAQQLNDIIKSLPDYCRDFFDSLEFTKQARTKVAYAYDIRTFYNFLVKEIPFTKGKDIKDVSLSDIEKVSAKDINDFLRYVKVYKHNGAYVTNSDKAAKRKLCALRKFYGYYYRYEIISANPSIKVDMPKIRDKAIVRLDVNEVADFLDQVETGDRLPENARKKHDKFKVRDLALLTLMLGTGIRVSECVGLDIDDLDFDNNRIKVVRKGGDEDYVYFGDEARDALIDYLEERQDMQVKEEDKRALFISQKKSRLTVRSVELLVKKYAATVTSLKHITPHKLRSTYGTNLYQASRDIYLVADVLGHKDVNTTRRHYADMDDENKREARNIVRLREKNE